MKFPGVQLSNLYTSFPRGLREVIVEPKIDGYRLLAIVGTRDVVFYSRKGNSTPYTANLRHVGQQLLKLGFRNQMIDGEIFVDGAWGKTAIAKVHRPDERQQKILRDKAVFFAFDLIIPNTPLRVRRARLKQKVRGGTKNVKLLPQRTARSDKEVRVLFAKAVKDGHEGVMVKDPTAPYRFTRTSAWLKLKPTQTIDVRITGFERGSGKNSGRLGAFVAKMKNGKQVKVGTGITDAQRTKFWAQRGQLKGKWIEVKVGKANEGSVRPASFVRLRVDRD